MFVYFILLLVLICFPLRVSWSSLNENYMSRNNTAAIKGMFISLVFLSHFKTYVTLSSEMDLWVVQLLNDIGQLMVAMFLFLSGYGVFESIKKKGSTYIQKFPVNRIGKTFFDFSLAVITFIILGTLIGRKFTLSQVILSFTGWTSVGNSNWYMFAIFCLYITTYFAFRLTNKSKHVFSLIFLTMMSFLYVYILSCVQPDRFSNTYLCYVAGMWYSYFKEKIDLMIGKSQTLYFITLLLFTVLFIKLLPLRLIRILFYNFVSIALCLLIVMFLMKIEFKNKILIWLGNHLFWVYILQRIPMILLSETELAYQPFIYLTSCIGLTLILVILFNKLSLGLKTKIFS